MKREALGMGLMLKDRLETDLSGLCIESAFLCVCSRSCVAQSAGFESDVRFNGFVTYDVIETRAATS